MTPLSVKNSVRRKKRKNLFEKKLNVYRVNAKSEERGTDKILYKQTYYAQVCLFVQLCFHRSSLVGVFVEDSPLQWRRHSSVVGSYQDWIGAGKFVKHHDWCIAREMSVCSVDCVSLEVSTILLMLLWNTRDCGCTCLYVRTNSTKQKRHGSTSSQDITVCTGTTGVLLFVFHDTHWRWFYIGTYVVRLFIIEKENEKDFKGNGTKISGHWWFNKRIYFLP